MNEYNLILHICDRDEWSSTQKRGKYHAPSLESVDFIHCSHPSWVLTVANNLYPGCQNLLLLWIDANKLRAEVRYESANGDTKDDKFPHIYGPINLDAIVSIYDFIPMEDGKFDEVPVF